MQRSERREHDDNPDLIASSSRNYPDSGHWKTHKKRKKKVVMAGFSPAGMYRNIKQQVRRPSPMGGRFFCRPRADWLNRTGNSRTYFLTNEGR